MHSHETCAACRAQVTPVRASFGARLALVALGLAFVAMAFSFPFFGFLWTFTIPVLMLAGMGLGPLVDAAVEPTICPACQRRFEPARLARESRVEEQRLPAGAQPTMLRP